MQSLSRTPLKLHIVHPEEDQLVEVLLYDYSVEPTTGYEKVAASRFETPIRICAFHSLINIGCRTGGHRCSKLHLNMACATITEHTGRDGWNKKKNRGNFLPTSDAVTQGSFQKILQVHAAHMASADSSGRAREQRQQQMRGSSERRPPEERVVVTKGRPPPKQSNFVYAAALPPYELDGALKSALPRSKAEATKKRTFRFAADSSRNRALLGRYGAKFLTAEDQVALPIGEPHPTSEVISSARDVREEQKNVRQLLHQQLFVDEQQCIIDLLAYAQTAVSIEPCNTAPNVHNAFTVPAPGVTENRPSVLRGDQIEVSIHIPDDDDADNGAASQQQQQQHHQRLLQRRWHRGYVHHVQLDKLVVSFDERSCISGSWRHSSFDVHFSMGNRTSLRNLHRAVDEGVVLTRNLIKRVEAQASSASPKQKRQIIEDDLDSKWPDLKRNELNAEQYHFVRNLVVKPNSVFICNGPPGTGKTTTITHGIFALLLTQGLRNSADSSTPSRTRILVSCPSNAAADLVVERMSELFDKTNNSRYSMQQMRRIHAMSRDPKDVSDVVKAHSPRLVAGGNFEFPSSFAMIQEYQIIVCTLATAAKLYSIGVPKADAFSHVFVDEAGQATEQEMMLATTYFNPGKTTLVLAGDHKQLGPIIHSGLCKESGHAVSTLERVIHPSVTPPENVTLLVKNYRSHPSLLNIVNVAYADKLICSRTDYSNCILPRLARDFKNVLGRIVRLPQTWTSEHPVLFLHKEGTESRDVGSPSWKNQDELLVVVDMVKSLINDHGFKCEEIVVLTPYLLQRKKLEQALFAVCRDYAIRLTPRDEKIIIEKKRCPIDCATTEAFQGKERRVVIVSCVRSSREDEVNKDIRHRLGFMSQPQRTNVALSRARDLMIIVGNCRLFLEDPAHLIHNTSNSSPSTTSTFGMWREVLNRINRLGGFVNLQKPSMTFGQLVVNQAGRAALRTNPNLIIDDDADNDDGENIERAPIQNNE